MESITDKCVNEHDYTLRMEVPLEAIKQEIIEQTVEDASSEDPECVRVPVILRDTKPKLRQPKPPKPRKRKEPKLLPRPDVPIPPPLNSNLGAVPPPNCKGVLVVQDVKFCTMYVPKNGSNVTPGVGLPLHSLPVTSLPINSIPVNSVPINSGPMSSVPFSVSAFQNLPVNSTAVSMAAMNSIPINSSIVNSAALNSVLANTASAKTGAALVNSTITNKAVVSSIPVSSTAVNVTTLNSTSGNSSTPNKSSANSISVNSSPFIVSAANSSPSISRTDNNVALTRLHASVNSTTITPSVHHCPVGSSSSISMGTSILRCAPSVAIASLRPDPPSSIVVSKDTAKQNKPYPLLGDVQKILCEVLPPFWFSTTEKNGMNLMLLSYGKEKAIQRRVFVSVGGSVEISVHCKPLSENFVSDIVKRAGTPVQLTVGNIKNFSEWAVKVVQVLRDLQVCTGLERPDLRDVFLKCDNVVVDDNPYQEGRYLETLRSKTCLRLVDPGRRRCAECSKAFSLSKKNLSLIAQDCQKKKFTHSVHTETNEIIADDASALSDEVGRNSKPPCESSSKDLVSSSDKPSSKKRKKAGREKQHKKKGLTGD